MVQCVSTILYVVSMWVVCMWYVIMVEDHRYWQSPILSVQRRFRVKCQHPNSQPPHTSNSVQNCDLTSTTSSQYVQQGYRTGLRVYYTCSCCVVNSLMVINLVQE